MGHSTLMGEDKLLIRWPHGVCKMVHKNKTKKNIKCPGNAHLKQIVLTLQLVLVCSVALFSDPFFHMHRHEFLGFEILLFILRVVNNLKT